MDASSLPFISQASNFIEKFAWYRQLGLDSTSIKRLLHLECRKNLSILEALSFDNDIKYDAHIYSLIAKHINYDVIELLLSSNDLSEKAFKELNQIPLISTEDLDSSHFSEKNEMISIASRLLNLYIRMHSVKTLASIFSDEKITSRDGLNKINFKLRLGNIKEALKALEKTLYLEVGK